MDRLRTSAARAWGGWPAGEARPVRCRWCVCYVRPVRRRARQSSLIPRIRWRWSWSGP